MTMRAPSRRHHLLLRAGAVAPAMGRWRTAFLDSVQDPLVMMQLFDRMPQVVFSVKDRAGRYVSISSACAERCGLARTSDAIGLTAHDLFPRHMADRYVRQDERVFITGRPIRDNLDLTLFPDRTQGWCLTDKVPLCDRQGAVVGLACLSQDLGEPVRAGLIDGAFAAVIDHIQEHFAETLRIPQLARLAGVSVAQFDRRMRAIFGISAIQFLIKTRIESVARALADSDAAIATVALDAGFCDQSALSRQFKRCTGLSPREYRQLIRSAHDVAEVG